MKEIRITVRCISSPTQHAKIIRVKAKLGRRKAQDLAELLDGTSLSYVHPPGPSSPIGRCCVCGSEVETEVSEILNGEEVPPTIADATESAARKSAGAERKLAKVLGIKR